MELPTVFERAAALAIQADAGSAAKRDEALGLALGLVEADAFQLSAVALILRIVVSAKRTRGVREAGHRLVDAFIRRGDLPAATEVTHLLDAVGLGGKAARKTIAAAFCAGSARGADVSIAPPALPVDVKPSAELSSLKGDAMLARAEAFLERFAKMEDTYPSASVPRLPLFSALAQASLEALLAAFQPRHLALDEMAIEQHEEGREAFVVVRGMLRADRAGEGGEDPTVLAMLGPGAIFGEMALVSDAPRAASVTAQEPSTLLVASRESLEKLAGIDATIGRELAEFCRGRMIANLLRTSALLRAIPNDERDGLMRMFVARTFAEGEALVLRGREATGLFLIASGSVRITTEDQDGDDLLVAELGPGDVVGEMALVLRRSASATAVATCPTVVLELAREQFQDAIRSHPTMLAELYHLASTRDDELRTVVAQSSLDVEEVVLV